MTRCRLVAVGLDDLAGETEPVNIPGTDAHQYPNWRRRMRRPMEAVEGDPTARFLVLGSYFAPGSDFREGLVKSLLEPANSPQGTRR